MNRQVNAPILFWDKKGFVISDLKFKLNGSLSFSGVFSMDEDSLSRDCEPFFESDGEEESTDGELLLLLLIYFKY